MAHGERTLRHERRVVGRPRALWGALLGIFLLVGCARQEEPGGSDRGARGSAADAGAAARRVAIVGIDGATWDVLDPLMAEGRMPHLARLTREGTRGVLRSMEPTASAIIWTTIATGKVPEKHGIHGFVTVTPSGHRVPVTSTLRRTKALWNIASDAGLTVGIIGWWVTWPAEEVRGFLCSDYTWPLRKDEQGFATGEDFGSDRSFRTYPESLMREIDPLLLTESRLSEAQLDSLGVLAIPAVEGYAVREVFLKDLSHIRISRYLLSRSSTRLFAVYFDGFDAFCHIFWERYKPYREAGGGTEKGAEGGARGERTEAWAKGAAMDDHLSRLDAYLGELMGSARPEDVVLVISDHGYGDNAGLRPILRGEGDTIRPPHWHTLDGVFAAWGGPIRKGARIDSLSVRDVTPIVLGLLDLPVARDMDGRIPAGLFEERAYALATARTIASYDSAAREGDVVASPYDEEVIERLRSLGYLD